MPISLVSAQTTSSPSAIAQVGTQTTYSSNDTTSATTAVPTGATSGDVLVSFIEAWQQSSVSCPTGWTQAQDVSNGTLSQLVTCVTAASSSQAAPTVTVSPASAVTMMTVAFSGVDTSQPVDGTAGATSMTAPSAALSAPTSTILDAAGWSDYSASNPSISAPSGSNSLGAVNGSRSHLGVADLTGSFSSSAPSGTFTASATPQYPVSTTLALRPASSGSTGCTTGPSSSTTAPPTTTADPPPPSSTSTTAAPVTTTTKPPATSTTTAPPATTTVPPTTAPPSSGTAQWTSSNAEGSWTAPNGYIVNNDAWNGSAGPQTITAYGYNNWTVKSDQPNNGGAVETYPDTEYNFNKSVGSLTNATSTFNMTDPAPGNGVQWDNTYDIWFNNWATEFMVLTDWTGQQIPPTATYTQVTLGGVTFDAWHNGTTFIQFDRVTPEASGSINLLPLFQYAVQQGWLSSSSMLGALEYGVEISSTAGTTQNYAMNNYSLNVS